MLEEFFTPKIIISVLIVLALVVSGFYLIRSRKKRRAKIAGRFGGLSNQLREIEQLIGSETTSSFVSIDPELILQNLSQRLHLILKKLKERQEALAKQSAGNTVNLDRRLTSSQQTAFQSPVPDENRTSNVSHLYPSVEIEISSAQDVADFGEDDFPKEIVSFYNEASNHRELRDRLWSDFEVSIIDNVTAVEQRLGNTLEPDFRQSDNGSMYAIKDSKTDVYFVIPKFDLTIKNTNYETTIKFLFDCGDFDESLTYTSIRLMAPAVFVREGDRWSKKSQGVLKLGA